MREILDRSVLNGCFHQTPSLMARGQMKEDAELFEKSEGMDEGNSISHSMTSAYMNPQSEVPHYWVWQHSQGLHRMKPHRGPVMKGEVDQEAFCN